jgi:hypothetical protein
LDFLSLKNDVNIPSKSNKQKIFFKLVFVGVLKVNDENSRIRIYTKILWIRNTAFLASEYKFMRVQLPWPYLQGDLDFRTSRMPAVLGGSKNFQYIALRVFVEAGSVSTLRFQK